MVAWKNIVTALNDEEYQKLMRIAEKMHSKGIIKKNTPYAVVKQAIREFIETHTQ